MFIHHLQDSELHCCLLDRMFALAWELPCLQYPMICPTMPYARLRLELGFEEGLVDFAIHSHGHQAHCGHYDIMGPSK